MLSRHTSARTESDNMLLKQVNIVARSKEFSVKGMCCAEQHWKVILGKRFRAAAIRSWRMSIPKQSCAWKPYCSIGNRVAPIPQPISKMCLPDSVVPRVRASMDNNTRSRSWTLCKKPLLKGLYRSARADPLALRFS